MSLLATRFESALVTYLSTLLPGEEILRGHSNETSERLPRIITTATSGGGDLVNDGIDQLAIEIMVLVSAGHVQGDPDPIVTLARMADTIRAALCLENMPTVLAAVNATPGLAVSAINYGGHKEGRDEERVLHGIALTYTVWAALTA